jgi:uncharacterized protein (TIGR03382 family)
VKRGRLSFRLCFAALAATVLGGARWGLFLSVACFAFLYSHARSASANAGYPGYDVTVDAGAVEVCLANAGESTTCGSPILREDEEGAFVSVATTVKGDDAICYVDECVPPGTYFYGCPELLSCGSPYFTSATVTQLLDGGCVRSPGVSPPMPVSSSLQWSVNTPSGSCPSGGCSTAGSGSAPDGSVLLLSLVLLWRKRRAARSTATMKISC